MVNLWQSTKTSSVTTCGYFPVTKKPEGFLFAYPSGWGCKFGSELQDNVGLDMSGLPGHSLNPGSKDPMDQGKVLDTWPY